MQNTRATISNIVDYIYPVNTAVINNTKQEELQRSSSRNAKLPSPASVMNNSRSASRANNSPSASGNRRQNPGYNPERIGGVSVFPALTRSNKTRMPSCKNTKKTR